MAATKLDIFVIKIRDKYIHGGTGITKGLHFELFLKNGVVTYSIMELFSFTQIDKSNNKLKFCKALHKLYLEQKSDPPKQHLF